MNKYGWIIGAIFAVALVGGGAYYFGMKTASRATPPATAAQTAATTAQSSAAAGGKTDLTPKVLVVDFEGVVNASNAGKGVRDQLETQRQAFQSEISGEEEKLRNMQQELVRARSKMTQEEFAPKQQAFERRVATLQQTVQDRKQQLDQAYSTALGKVQSSLIGIVEQLATQRGANMVLRKAEVVLVANYLDVSKEALDQLNKDLGAVKVTIPPAQKPGAKADSNSQ